RHLSIVQEINRRFLRRVQIAAPTDEAKRQRMSIIEGEKIRMAHLAVVGSHSVNGVAQLHTDLLRNYLLRDFAEMFPERFNNKTNGVTPRRWLLLANRRLAAAITERIGDGWITDLPQLEGLSKFVDDGDFHRKLAEIKRANKVELAEFIRERNR